MSDVIRRWKEHLNHKALAVATEAASAKFYHFRRGFNILAGGRATDKKGSTIRFGHCLSDVIRGWKQHLKDEAELEGSREALAIFVSEVTDVVHNGNPAP